MTPASNSATSGAKRPCRQTGWKSWSRRTSGVIPASRWRELGSSGSCPSTGGPCGRPSRTPPATSTSTSGPGGWRSTSGPSRNSTVQISSGSSMPRRRRRETRDRPFVISISVHAIGKEWHVTDTTVRQLSEDEQRLAELGYKQELNRSWSGFSNFAISFSIISILAGCFTTFFAGWNNGGPAAIAWGWPIVSCFILVIGLCMSELVSAFPTSGGIYWWSSKLGGVKAGFYTGWLNLIGLIAILASVSYGCATFLDLTLGTFSEGWLAGYSLTRTFIIFLIILAISATINIFSSHLLAIINNISVWWHVAGAAVVIVILWVLPEQHASLGDVFARTINNSGMFGG